MQRWEYLSVWAPFGQVTQVNGQQVGKSTLLGGVQGEVLSDFLSRVGLDGWELVSVFRTADSYELYFKRPLQ